MKAAAFSVASTWKSWRTAICAMATVAEGMHSVCRKAAVLEKISALNRGSPSPFARASAGEANVATAEQHTAANKSARTVPRIDPHPHRGRLSPGPCRAREVSVAPAATGVECRGACRSERRSLRFHERQPSHRMGQPPRPGRLRQRSRPAQSSTAFTVVRS